jgi:CheY-like chemotaxis protein
VSVSDTGLGIPKELQSKIFEPFFTTKEVGKGTGLGLSMVYGIMKNHGGAVTLYSEVGHGTRFNLYFPAVSEQAEQSTPLPPRSEPPEQPHSERLIGKMVLVVDDEPLMMNLARDILTKEGATLFSASNGEEAISFLQTNHQILNLVLLDVIMPKMDGIKAFREIRKLAPNLPVIFVSGYAESESISTLRKSGNVHFIQKPYRSAALLELVSKALEESELSVSA